MFRKKPVEIEARRFQEGKEYKALLDWINYKREGKWVAFASVDNGRIVQIVIPTLEGKMRASLGDWIIKSVAGEFYACKPDIFEATYEPVSGTETGTQGEGGK